MAAVEDAAGFLAARLFIGFSMAEFVACQFWCSVMFTPRWGGGGWHDCAPTGKSGHRPA